MSKWLLRGAIVLVCVGLLGWMSLACLFSPLEPAWLRSAGAALFPLAALVAVVFVRPVRRVAVGILVVFAGVLAAYLSNAPSNDRNWQPDVALPAYAEIRGDHVTVHNVRNAHYRSETDYDVHYEVRELDLAGIRSLDLFLIHWGSPAIAHTIMSWGFEDGQYLAISIETRKEVGEDYSALRGFFRNYELIYIVADERDVIRLRTNFRGEDVYVYRFAGGDRQLARKLLLRYFEALNGLRDDPEWYNALTENCTTTIQHLAAPYEQRSWWSWKLLLNGYLDELGYEIGAFDRSLPFPELKRISHVNARALAAGDDPDYSRLIRAGVPLMTESLGP